MSVQSTDHARSRSGYGDLSREIRERGLLRPRTGFYWMLGSANLLLLLGVVVALVLLRHSWWVIAIAPVFAASSAQIAFFSHDAAHRQITRSARITRLLSLTFGNLLNGLSYGWWTAKHNAHHAHPNDLETDPDVGAGAFVWDAGQAGRRTGAGAWWTRHQAAMFFPVLTLEAFNLRISSVRAVLQPGIRNRRIEGVLLLGHFVLYASLLAGTMTVAQAAVFVLVHQGLFGVYLGCSFAPSHKGMPTLSGSEAADPLLRQVLTSRNIRGGHVVDFALGGLNLQVEHHLFPSMPRPNLRRAQPIVESYCHQEGIPYAETSLLGAYGLALRHMHEVGAPLRASAGDHRA